MICCCGGTFWQNDGMVTASSGVGGRLRRLSHVASASLSLFRSHAWDMNRSGIYLLYSILPAYLAGASGLGPCPVTCTRPCPKGISIAMDMPPYLHITHQ